MIKKDYKIKKGYGKKSSVKQINTDFLYFTVNLSSAAHLRGCIHWFVPSPVPVLVLASPAPSPVRAPVPSPVAPFLVPSPSLSPAAPGHAPSPAPSLHWQRRQRRGGLDGLRIMTHITHNLYTHTHEPR